jgi:hypothetical protein
MLTEFTGPSGMKVCAHSLEHANLATAYEVHFASPEEITQNGGVCAACAAKFRKNHHNAAAIAGAVELPVTISEAAHVTISEDHAATCADGSEQITDFNFADIDIALGAIEDESPNVRADAAALFAALMTWIWSPGNIKTAMIKMSALTASLNPTYLSDKSYLEIANELGTSKQAISKAALKFSDKFGVQWFRSRSVEARENMRLSQLGHGPRRGKKSVPIADTADTYMPHGGCHKDSF